MKRIWLIVTTLGANVWIGSNQMSAAETVAIDLTQWTPPDISKVGEDPFGDLVKYGHALFTDTPNEIGPEVSDAAKRFAGNNLACQNCHLKAGTQPYAMPLIGVWGQFPQYRGREGAVDMLEERINGCMERSMNGRALPLESREMKAFSSYMRWRRWPTSASRWLELVSGNAIPGHALDEGEQSASPAQHRRDERQRDWQAP